MTQHQTPAQVGKPAQNVTSSLKYGGRASALYAAPGADDLGHQADLASTYITQLRQQAVALIGGGIAASLVPIQFNGEFNWYWSNGELGKFNNPTYNYVSAAVGPSPDLAGTYQVGAAGSFVTLYKSLITGIGWRLSAADTAALQAAQTQSLTQQASIVQSYNSSFGAPSQAQMTTAQAYNPLIQTTFDYIIDYLAAYIWAGRPTTPLTLYRMQSAPNLRELLQFAPASAQSIIQQLPAYLNAIGPASTIMDQQSAGASQQADIARNLTTPSQSNGGITFFNPLNSTAYYSGFTSNMGVSGIMEDLQNASQAITLTLSVSKSSSSSYNIGFSGQAGIDWTGDIIGISAGSSFRGNVASAQSDGSTMVITLTYPGVTIIPFSPTSWQQNSTGSVGWWSPSIIYQAWTNFQAGANAQTGFDFVSGVPEDIALGQDGLGYLSAIVVSGEPTIKVECSQGSYSEVSSWLATNSSFSVSLFGFIPLGSSSVDTYSASASQSSSGSGFSLTLTPPAPGSGGNVVPADQQTVPVLAGQIYWAGSTQS